MLNGGFAVARRGAGRRRPLGRAGPESGGSGGGEPLPSAAAGVTSRCRCGRAAVAFRAAAGPARVFAPKAPLELEVRYRPSSGAVSRLRLRCSDVRWW